MQTITLRITLIGLLFFLSFPEFGAQPKSGLEIGNKAPEISLKNPNGEQLSLSELKGKVVLISFWASWCGPCRRESPNYVAIYNEFKNKQFKNGNDFTIFSVSLDRNADAWKKAIQDDALAWNTHVSDLAGWQSDAARLYGINSIPSNVLISGDGIILAKNIKGEELSQFLKQLIR